MKQTCVIYCRVSSKQQEDGFSLENQEEACRNYCEKNNLHIIGVFKESFTGKSTSRPIFDESIKNAKKNNVNCYIIFDIDRFSREGYGVYQTIKEDLYNNGIALRDSKNIIQSASLVYEDDEVDMEQYKWNKNEPSKYAEVFMSTYAELEGHKILQRTIPREIQLEKMGYQVRQPNYGLKNKKITLKDGKKATIQVPHPITGCWVIEMFESRAKGILTDKEIVDILNLKGCKTDRGNKMTVRYMQEVISKTIYAGVKTAKWTGDKPIIVPYQALVSVELWNQANRGKHKIYQYKDKVTVDKPEKKDREIPSAESDPYIFRGKLMYQGFALSGYTTKGNIYYRSKNGLKPNINISQNDLLDIMEEEIKTYKLPEELKQKVEGDLFHFLEKQYEVNLGDEKRIEKELLKLKEENKGVTKQNAVGRISNEMMDEIIAENDIKIKDCNKRLIQIGNQKELISENVYELLKFLLNTEKLWKKSNLYQKGRLLDIFLYELSFASKKQITIRNTPFYKLLKNVNYVMAPPLGIEPRMQDLESGVITT